MSETIPDLKETGENIPVKRGRVSSITLYDVTDYELDQLEKGSPESLYLNFSISLLTTGSSFLLALLTTTITSNRTFDIFVIITIISFISGTVLFILWFRGRKSVKRLVEKIKNRCDDY